MKVFNILAAHALLYYHLIQAEDNISPLILTSYLKSGNVDKARILSKVTPDIGNVTSYTGFFTVDEKCDNNLFFWFFPALKDWQDAPIILWLQGGPGSSSMFGLFELIGPFNSFPSGLQARKYSWSNLSNLLFIDSPVGAGYSFTTEKCFAQNITAVVDNLYDALIQFFLLFPEIQKNSFFITGESFAGHCIPPLGKKIHKEISAGEITLNLSGILIGNPLIKLTCHDYGSFLYQVGIADNSLRDDLYKRQKMLREHVQAKNYTAAFSDWDYILNDLINNRTQMPSRFNILTEAEDPSDYDKFIITRTVRDQIHVGNVNYSDVSWDAYNALSHTIAQPFTDDVEELLKTGKYVVGFYSGQLDVICMYASTVCVMRGLKWRGQADYLNATRNIWYIDDQVVGWFKTTENLLLDILIKDSGHSVPFYKPGVTYAMIESILSAGSGRNPLWKLQTSD